MVRRNEIFFSFFFFKEVEELGEKEKKSKA